MTHDQVLDGDERDKDDESDDVVPADHELTECLNHLAGSLRAFASVQQDAPGTGQIQRQAHQRQQEDETGKHGELYRAQHLNGGQQHQHRGHDAQRQQKIERKAGQRH